MRSKKDTRQLLGIALSVTLCSPARKVMQRQGQFNFDADPGTKGYTQWLAARKIAARELARRIGLPLGHEVEVWLYGGILLKGKLRLQEEKLFIREEEIRHLELCVDYVTFTYRELQSCVRLD
jgi:hypothetical protein